MTNIGPSAGGGEQILVTGGTGTLGSHVVPGLVATGASVRVLSRQDRTDGDGVEYIIGDLVTNDGLGEAMHGVSTIVHLAGGPKGDDVAAEHLVTAASQAGVQHLVFISVIGADRVPLAYFRAKASAEATISASGVPWTLLRAAQFHELMLTVCRGVSKLPVIPAPRGVRLQPVDSSEVAERIVDLATGSPRGRVPDLAGPEVAEFPRLLRRYLQVVRKRRVLAPLRLPGKVGRAYRAGENLSSDGSLVGQRTWDEFLSANT